ncbi:hypothetical protein BVX98_03450 [bacterium F11]|nr:hypothetical protein BVX98_03450 [bacterium F11]
MKKLVAYLLLGGFLGLIPKDTLLAESNEEWKKEMERKIDILTRELEKGKHSPIVKPIYESKHGFAPAAAKVYHTNHGVSIGGYGEMIYNDFQSQNDKGQSSGSKDKLDFLRSIVYIGYKYTDKILFNSEIEFEHATTSNNGSRGEVSLEFANLDFLLHPMVGARVGLLLVPVGIRNELHEPTLFHGTARPSTEQRIIPTTWRENGLGVFGRIGSVEYRTYLITGLQAVEDSGNFGGFGSSGIRGGRSKGSKSLAEDKAWVGRMDYDGIPGTRFGGSYYIGDAGQDSTNAQGKEIEGTVTLWEIHGEAEYKGAEVTGLYAKGTVDDVADLNAAQPTPLSGNGSIGEEMFGGYIQVAFDVFSLFQHQHVLAPFFRYERYDTQQKVPTGFSKNPARDVTEYTFGVSYKPHPNVILKIDFQNQNNEAGTGVDSTNAGMGFLF